MKRILFVDDDSNILDAARRMLRGQRGQWEMQFAASGASALRECVAKPFDIVISDMRMPDMDGATLLGHIRDRYPATVRCILSGYSEFGLTARAIPVAHRILSKPFKGDDLQTAIERILALEDVLRSPDLRQIMGTIGELPSLSRTYLDLTRAAQDPHASLAKIAAIISGDVAMSAKVLQLVNSGFFGLAQLISNIESAVLFLGMDTIKDLALASETFRMFPGSSRVAQPVFEEMQSHSRRAATIAAHLPSGTEDGDATFAAALLHDIGKLVMASKLPEQFCAAQKAARETGCEPFEAEEAILGVSHAEIGAYLLGLWGIDALVVEAVAHHHRPTRIPHSRFDCSTAVFLADLLAHEAEDRLLGRPDRELSELNAKYLAELGAMDLYLRFRGSNA
jgi:putative nucleotidyltransferase with HDIG domain